MLTMLCMWTLTDSSTPISNRPWNLPMMRSCEKGCQTTRALLLHVRPLTGLELDLGLAPSLLELPGASTQSGVLHMSLGTSCVRSASSTHHVWTLTLSVSSSDGTVDMLRRHGLCWVLAGPVFCNTAMPLSGRRALALWARRIGRCWRRGDGDGEALDRDHIAGSASRSADLKQQVAGNVDDGKHR